MADKSPLHIGIAAIAFAAFLFLVGIPFGITSPSNVSKIVLSPLFWPEILAAMLAVAGLGLVITGLRPSKLAETDQPARVEGGFARLAIMALIMVLYVILTPTIGMVWTSMAAFAAMAFLIRTHHPKSALVAAILVPLVLYGFFAHVAGVAIPQGDFVRLP